MVAVHVLAGAVEGISCENDIGLGVVLMLTLGTLTMLYTVVPCWRVIAHVTVPLPVVDVIAKLNFTVAPGANEVAATPALFNV